jgi:uncharacterized membrane protein
VSEVRDNSADDGARIGWTAPTAAVVSLVGLADSAYLTVKHFEGTVVPCDLVSGCEKVLSSAYSEFWGIPLAAFGAFAYFIAFSFSVLVSFGRTGLWKMFGLQALTMALFSAWLVYLQASVIGAFCQFCLISAATSTLLLAVYTASLIAKPSARAIFMVSVLAALGVGAYSIFGPDDAETPKPSAAPPSS